MSDPSIEERLRSLESKVLIANIQLMTIKAILLREVMAGRLSAETGLVLTDSPERSENPNV